MAEEPSLSELKKEAWDVLESGIRAYYRDAPCSIPVKNEARAVKKMHLILGAALKLARRKGFAAMNLRDLCRESGLSIGCLYEYVASKDELRRILYMQGQTMVKWLFGKRFDRTGCPRGKLRNLIRLSLYLGEILGDWFFFFFMECKHLRVEERTDLMEYDRLLEGLIVEILDEGKRCNIFSGFNSTMAGSMAKSVIQDWYLKRWKYSKDNISVKEFADYVIGFIESTVIGA